MVAAASAPSVALERHGSGAIRTKNDLQVHGQTSGRAKVRTAVSATVFGVPISLA